jgi:DNA-binding ferritin-like protein
MISDLLLSYIACTKATEMWFHAAHHVTKGKGFAGDHNILYSKIYELLGKDLDSLVEKGIGIFDEEQLACPIIISNLAAKVVCKFKSPANINDHDIAEAGLDVLNHHLSGLEVLYTQLEASQYFTIGFDDLLASMANEYERYIYMLKQRLK